MYIFGILQRLAKTSIRRIITPWFSKILANITKTQDSPRPLKDNHNAMILKFICQLQIAKVVSIFRTSQYYIWLTNISTRIITMPWFSNVTCVSQADIDLHSLIKYKLHKCMHNTYNDIFNWIPTPNYA